MEKNPAGQKFWQRGGGEIGVGDRRYIGKHGHGQTDTNTRTRKTDSYGKDGHFGKDGQLWKRRALMEKTDTYRKDLHLWKRRALIEKTGTYGNYVSTYQNEI